MDASVRGKLRDHICVDNSDLSWQCHNQINYVNSCIESAKIHHPSNNCQNDDVWSLSGTIFSHSPTNTQINAVDQNKNSQTTKSLFWDQQDWVWYMKRSSSPCEGSIKLTGPERGGFTRLHPDLLYSSENKDMQNQVLLSLMYISH